LRSGQARLAQLAEHAGVRSPTLIVLRGASRLLNAAATQSLLTSPKVVIMGDIIETLTRWGSFRIFRKEGTVFSTHPISMTGRRRRGSRPGAGGRQYAGGGCGDCGVVKCVRWSIVRGAVGEASYVSPHQGTTGRR
jgi:hypothetical protein